MPLPVNPPSGARFALRQCAHRARKALPGEERKGQAGGAAGGPFLARGDGGRGGGSAVRGERRARWSRWRTSSTR